MVFACLSHQKCSAVTFHSIVQKVETSKEKRKITRKPMMISRSYRIIYYQEIGSAHLYTRRVYVCFVWNVL